MIKGTELFVKALKAEGIDLLFGYPGGYNMDVLDALYEDGGIEVVLPRHEQGLGHAADGYARATGKPGIALVTSGPGATNLVTPIATAYYDSVPMICFSGQVPTHLIGNDAFQEVDIISMTRTITKYAVTVRSRKDLGRVIKEAFYIATTGRPGPVIVDLPKDVMLAMGDESYPETVNIRGYKPTVEPHVGQLKRAKDLLAKAKHPLFLVGGGLHRSKAKEALTNLVEKTHIPVVTTIMGKGAIDTEHPYYIGNLGMHGSYAANMAISHCDLLFSIGTRFSDRITGKIAEFAPHAKIIHMDIDSASISRNIEVDIPIVSDAKLGIEKLMDYVKSYDTDHWLEEIKGWKEKHTIKPNSQKGIRPEVVFQKIHAVINEPIVVTDVGQHQMWTTQYIEMNGNTQLLTSGGLGTMGFGFPAAIGAQTAYPNRPVVCITGDGGFQMNLQELATAVAYELPIIICVFNNGYLGMVRQWQQLFFDKRYASTCTKQRKSCASRCQGPNDSCPAYIPNFVKLAESYEAHGIHVTEESQIGPAFEAALSHKDKPTLIEFAIDMEQIVLPMVKSGMPLNDMILED